MKWFRRLHARSFVKIKAQNCEQIILMEKRFEEVNFFLCFPIQLIADETFIFRQIWETNLWADMLLSFGLAWCSFKRLFKFYLDTHSHKAALV